MINIPKYTDLLMMIKKYNYYYKSRKWYDPDKLFYREQLSLLIIQIKNDQKVIDKKLQYLIHNDDTKDVISPYLNQLKKNDRYLDQLLQESLRLGKELRI